VPDHPDHEELAAYQAGDGDRRQRSRIEAHLVGCPACAGVVGAAGVARSRLALLEEEPELPAGLHERLVAAVDRELAGPAPLRRAAWWQRPAAWGAAAAVLLLAVALIPLLHLAGGGASTTGSGMAESSTRAQPAPVGGLAVLSLPGEFSPARLRVLLAADATARRAFQAAGGSAPAAPSAGGRDAAPGGSAQAPSAGQGAAPGMAAQSGPETSQAPQRAPGGAAAGGLQAACVAAASQASGQPVRAAFLLATSFRGVPATLLVAPADGGADVYAFPRGDCSGPPLAVQHVSGTG
jgi:hypothetical protein